MNLVCNLSLAYFGKRMLPICRFNFMTVHFNSSLNTISFEYIGPPPLYNRYLWVPFFSFKNSRYLFVFLDLHCDLFKKKKNLLTAPSRFWYGPASLKNEHKIRTLYILPPFQLPYPAIFYIYTHTSGCQ